MEFILIIALVVVCVRNSSLSKKLKQQLPSAELTPELIGQEAENMRRASENALRTKAETLIPRYEASGLVQEVLARLHESMKFDDQLWDVELQDNEIVVTTMTDVVDDRLVLVKEFYDFQAMGYETPSREGCHRLALALAIQKALGSDYGVGYQFRYNSADNSHSVSRLTVSYRRKQRRGVHLKPPLA